MIIQIWTTILSLTTGFYCDDYALLTPKGPCSAGFYCPEGQNVSSPLSFICTPGHYCPPGSSTETACASGTYQDEFGKVSRLIAVLFSHMELLYKPRWSYFCKQSTMLLKSNLRLYDVLQLCFLAFSISLFYWTVSSCFMGNKVNQNLDQLAAVTFSSFVWKFLFSDHRKQHSC